jgi:hypothetical protein
MATTTTNFGWDIPQSTDLVKDGATAIAALGQDIDTAFVDLKGGTTGQVLAKASNTDLDYSWVAQDDSNAIQNAIVDAKGDLIAATANDTPARLAVGANDTMLVADSTTATGLAYKSATTLYPWQTWTPTYSGITVGNGTVIARYQQIGKLVNIEYRLTFGSTTTISAPARLTPPVSINLAQYFAFNGVALDAGTAAYQLWIDPGNANLLEFLIPIASGTYITPTSVSATVPFTFTTNDVLTLRATYEAV